MATMKQGSHFILFVFESEVPLPMVALIKVCVRLTHMFFYTNFIIFILIFIFIFI